MMSCKFCFVLLIVSRNVYDHKQKRGYKFVPRYEVVFQVNAHARSNSDQANWQPSIRS